MNKNLISNFNRAVDKQDVVMCKKLLAKIALSESEKQSLLKKLSTNLEVYSKAKQFYENIHKLPKKTQKIILFCTILCSPIFLIECYINPWPDQITPIKFIFYMSCFITALFIPIGLLCSMPYKHNAHSYNNTNEIINLIKKIGQK